MKYMDTQELGAWTRKRFPTSEKYSDENPYIHIDDLLPAKNIEDQIKRLVRALYETGNIAEIEDSLDELSSVFDIKVPLRDPVMVRKPEPQRNSELTTFITFLTHEHATA
jgi:hypothetical protein